MALSDEDSFIKGLEEVRGVGGKAGQNDIVISGEANELSGQM